MKVAMLYLAGLYCISFMVMIMLKKEHVGNVSETV